MRNCPFHALHHEHRDLVCHANHARLTGLVDGLEADGLQAVYAPAEGRCCVLLRPTTDGYSRTLHATA
jgi:predicted ArsR family transcriptional regulator